MEEWKKKQAEKEKEGSATNDIIEKMRLDQARLRAADIEDSGNSSSLSVPKTFSKDKPVEESYTTDDWEEVSMSGSGSKKIESWSGKTKTSGSKPTRIDDSLKSSNSYISASNSKSINDMKSNSRVADSSDVYDTDDFENSVSKSHKEVAKALPTIKKLETLKSRDSNSPSPPLVKKTSATATPLSIAQAYARKENKQTMTDEGKYSYMSSQDAAPNNLREFTLKKNLEDAEHMI